MLDRLTGLQVFSRAVALGSLSAAARGLGMSQTMATKHMDALEYRLGVRLLHRTTRSLALTEQGRRYLEYADRILAEWQEAEAEATAERLDVSGTLRVNAPLSFGFRQIAPLMPEFGALHPGLTVDLGLNDRLVDLVDEGWDLAVRIGALPDSNLVSRTLAACRMIICASPTYLARRGRPSRVDELAGHECLTYTLSRTLNAGVWSFGAGVTVPVTGPLRASNGDALVAAAIGGMGIIYEPSFLVVDALRSGALCPLVLDQPVRSLAISAVWPGGRRPPAKVRAYVDFLAARLGPSPPWEAALP
ncbi:MAG: LysR family transcriptional regulator [Alsobacter sp.]